MRKINLFLLINLITLSVFSQVETTETIYRRSSLYTLMIHEPNRQYAEVISNTFLGSPIPEKFNDHNLKNRAIEHGVPPEIITRQEKIKKQEENISNFLSENKIARDIVAKWFKRSNDGAFNMDLIAERGSYNASEMDVKFAMSTERGLALLADAGEELIKNTFVIVNDFDYISKEEVANVAIKGISLFKEVKALVNDEQVDTTKGFLELGVKVAGKGYVVRTTSYLYQLDWNDSVAAVFYNDYWMDKTSLNRSKKIAFDNTDLFQLKLVGRETAWADLQSTIFTTKTEEELISIATVRAIDNVIAKLQREYDVFKTKTPLYNNDPLSAKIGLKEGLEKGDKFEVLEQVMDKKGRTFYKKRGEIRVEKDHIWDNRFMAAEEQQLTDNLIPPENYTVFKGNSKYYIGWLIRQIK
jgi:hypothetical protein